MGRAPCCEKVGLKKGPWDPEEDQILIDYIQKNGHGSWRTLPKLAGLLRCGKSCRLRWTNYLRPDIKRGPFTEEEERSIIQLHALLGNKWSAIASQLPGRTDNEIKNYWNTHLQKRLLRADLDSGIHSTGGFGCAGFPCISASSSSSPSSPSSSWIVLRHLSQWENARLQAEARHSSKDEPLFRALGHSPSAAPVDCFLKIWNSEAGRAFREGAKRTPPQGSPNNNVNPGSSNNNNHHHHRPCSRSMTSLCSVSTMHNNNNEDGHQQQQRQQHPGSLGCLNNGNQNPHHHHQTKNTNEEEYNRSCESERANNLNDARHYRDLAELLFDFSSVDENDIAHDGSSGNQDAHVFGTDLNKELLEPSEWNCPDLALEASEPDQEDKDYWNSMLSI